jgi:hypothetical protein
LLTMRLVPDTTELAPARQLLGELGEGGLKVLDDLGGDDARRRKVNTRSPNGQVLIGGDRLWDTGWTGRHPMDRRWTAAQVTAPDRTGWTFGTVS